MGASGGRLLCDQSRTEPPALLPGGRACVRAVARSHHAEGSVRSQTHQVRCFCREPTSCLWSAVGPGSSDSLMTAEELYFSE